MNKLPNAKTNDFVVQNLNDEILIYNLTDNKAFCLNKTSAIVYQACDGETSFADLQKKSGFTEDLIHLTLAELEKQGFLEIPADYVSPLAGMSRREAVKKVGLATMIALPVISSVIAPQALNAQSQSCFHDLCTGSESFTQGSCCTSNFRCFPNLCTYCIPGGSHFNNCAGVPTGCSDLHCNSILRKNLCCNTTAPATHNGTYCACGS